MPRRLGPCLLGLGLVAAPLCAGPIYVLRDLGVTGEASVASALSPDGRVAGWSVSAAGTIRGFQTGGGDPVLGGGLGSAAHGINDAGQAVGVVYGPGGQGTAALWEGGLLTTLSPYESAATAINASGAITGSFNGRAGLYSGGTLLDLNVGGSWSSGYAINSGSRIAGTVLGDSGDFGGFLWDPAAGATVLGTLGGGSSYAHGLNDSGWVVGTAATGAGWLHAALWRDGAVTDLGTAGGSMSGAYGINDAGYIVGYSQTAGGASIAALWIEGLLYDLNQVAEGADGWTLVAARAINNRGQIVGVGLYNNLERAFLLDPLSVGEVSFGAATFGADVLATPEPSTIALVASGFAVVAFRRRRSPV